MYGEFFINYSVTSGSVGVGSGSGSGSVGTGVGSGSGSGVTVGSGTGCGAGSGAGVGTSGVTCDDELLFEDELLSEEFELLLHGLETTPSSPSAEPPPIPPLLS